MVECNLRLQEDSIMVECNLRLQGDRTTIRD